MKTIKRKHVLLVGLTLFSMFFGAGNLIFPPFLGVQAGTSIWIAMLGFAVSAIGIPVLGVAAVAKSGGLEQLAGRVHPIFAAVFTMLIYLSIGPCLAIPRTAGTSFEMAVLPFVNGEEGMGLFRTLYSVVFFAAAMVVAWKPEKLTERLGKIMTPCLLCLIAVIFMGSMIHPAGGYGTPQPAYKGNPLIKGFLEGYLTMDAIAALNFGIIISLNIRSLGVEEDNLVVKETVRAGMVAGALLLMVYAALAQVGGTSYALGMTENGAQTLTEVAHYLFGRPGQIMLALIFVIACLNTCIGLISCCSKYFELLMPKIPYKVWAAFFAGISGVIANAGLNRIMEFSVPVLNTLYPMAIVLIVLAFFHGFLKKFPLSYPVCVLFTGIIGLVRTLDTLNLRLPGLTDLARRLPWYDLELGWVIPAVLGLILGILLSAMGRNRE